MESSRDPEIDAAAAVSAIESAQRDLAASLQLPRGFYGSIGAAIAVQIATLAVGVAIEDGLWLAAAGGVIFLVVAGVQIRRFQQLNGVRMASLVSRVVFGTSMLVSAVYAITLVAAVWAALDGAWWLVAVASAAGGVGYAVSGQRWVQAYRRDPGTVGRSESLWLTGTLVAAGIGLLVVLLVNG